MGEDNNQQTSQTQQEQIIDYNNVQFYKDYIQYFFDNKLDNLFMNLTGKVFNPETNSFMQMGKRRINDKGAMLIVQTMDFRGNINFKMNNFSQEEIERWVKKFTKDITICLGVRWKEFEIDPADFPMLVNDCVDFMFAVLKKSKDDRERLGFWGKISKFSTSTNSTQSNKSGFMDAINKGMGE